MKITTEIIIEEEVSYLCKRYPKLNSIKLSLNESIKLIHSVIQNNGKILVCGNGGSAADSEHIVGELLKGFKSKRVVSSELNKNIKEILDKEDATYLSDNLQMPIAAISLTGHYSFASAFANDVCHELTYAQHLLALGQSNDILLAISTSGNSKNVIWATKMAKVLGIKTIGITGDNGGALSILSDICIKAPETEVHFIQELHLPIYHTICLALERCLFPS